MFHNIRQKIGKKIKMHHIFIICQLLVLGIAVLSYLLNRGKAYQQQFDLSELSLTDSILSEEGITVDSTRSQGGVFLQTKPLSLEKGTYRIQVDYHTDDRDNTIQAFSSELRPVDWYSAPITLSPAGLSSYLTMELSRDAEDVVIQGNFSGSGSLTINSLGIYETSNLYKQNLFYALLFCAALCFVYYFLQSDRTRRETILVLSGIFLVSCYPLFVNYLMVGHDIPFHLLRIEGIATGLSQGVFPVKIHPVWAQDFGYAVGVFYGDFLLYIPALMRLFGLPIQTAFRLFAALMQLATVAVSYFTFKRMFRSRNIGVLGALFYTLSLYRLEDVYTRASVGEYSAMLFFPIVFCGFYLIFTEAAKGNWWKYAILTALGLTGLVQSHILSCEMTILFVGIACILLIRQVIRPYKYLALFSGAVLTVLLNLGFLVPFLSYFNEDITIHSADWTGSTTGAIQDIGLFPLQLFSLFQRSNGGSWSTLGGVSNEASYGMGIAYFIGLSLFLYLLLCYRRETAKDRNFLPACVSFGLGSLALWMSTCYFPWDTIASASPVLDKLIVSLEFPWRMLAPATILLTFVVCFAFSRLSAMQKELPGSVILTACIVLMLVNIGWYYYDFCYTVDPYRVHETYELDSMSMYSYDYLPAGTDPAQISAGKVLTDGVASIDDFQKQGTKILCRITAEDRDGWIDLPLNYYADYKCKVVESGAELTVSAGTNNMVRVSFPAGFTGTLQVFFKEPLHWRISEVISLFTLLGCAGFYGFCTFKEKSLRSKEKLGL